MHVYVEGVVKSNFAVKITEFAPLGPPFLSDKVSVRFPLFGLCLAILLL